MSFVRTTDAFPIARIRLPGNFEAVKKEPRTKALADSIEANGLIHRPCLLARSHEVICGVHRIAACVLLGRSEVSVDEHEFDDLSELRTTKMRLAENLHRGDGDRSELQRQYVELCAQEIAGSVTRVTEQPLGRPKTTKGKAREQAARELGTTTAALKQAEYRERKKEHEESPQQAEGCLESWGVFVPPDVDASARRAQEHIDAADALFRRAGAELTALGKDGFRPAFHQVLADRRQIAADELRRHRPAALCPWCKGKASIRSTCSACLGSGYAVEYQLSDCPPELKARGDAAVAVVDGKTVSYASVGQVKRERPEICSACKEAHPGTYRACKTACEMSRIWEGDPQAAFLDDRMRASAVKLGLLAKPRRVHVQDEDGNAIPIEEDAG